MALAIVISLRAMATMTSLWGFTAFRVKSLKGHLSLAEHMFVGRKRWKLPPDDDQPLSRPERSQ